VIVRTAPATVAAGISGRLAVHNDVNGHQVTYNGHPLYTFADDHAGQVTGRGIQNFFVATPGLAPLRNRAPASSSRVAGCQPTRRQEAAQKENG
jgi:Secreted repeat of unknown function